MHATFSSAVTTHEQYCLVLEALCEGYVRAMMEEIDCWPEGEFPCCIKCGKFRTRNAPLTPAQAESLTETLEHGHPVSGLQRHHLAEVLVSHGHRPPPYMSEPVPSYEVHVRNAKEILSTRGGTTIELACYQCAMKRRGGADPLAKVIVCCTGYASFRAAVLMSTVHQKPEKRLMIDDPVVDARPIGACGCGVHD